MKIKLAQRRTQQDRQMEPSVKTLRFPLFIEFCSHCAELNAALLPRNCLLDF